MVDWVARSNNCKYVYLVVMSSDIMTTPGFKPIRDSRTQGCTVP